MTNWSSIKFAGLAFNIAKNDDAKYDTDDHDDVQ